MPLKNLKSLLIEQMNELYAAEKHGSQVFPRMARAATSTKLAKTLREFAEDAKEHHSRLERAFDELGVKPRQAETRGMKGLLEDCLDLAANETAEPHVRDAALIAVAQHVKHDEIAGYGCAHAWAALLDLPSVESQLLATLKDEKQADAILSRIAEGLNKDALTTAGA